MPMVLRRDGGQLALRRSITRHVMSRKGGIDIHEHTIRFLRDSTGRRLDTRAEFEKTVLVSFRSCHIPCAFESAERAALVVGKHFFGTYCYHDLVLLGLQGRDGQLKRGGAAGARVLNIY